MTSEETHRLNDILGAVYRRDVATVKRLAATSVKLRDRDGRTILMHAILAETPDLSIIQVLVDAGTEVNAFDLGERWTALHFAARDQNESIVSILLTAGATVDPIDVFGNTPLWRSVMNASPDLGTIKVLLAHGANPGRKNRQGVAPTDLARKTGRADIGALLAGNVQ